MVQNEKAQRADAVRNRGRLLDAAAAAFAEHGMEVSISQIAELASVGKATVFRNFATKEDLVAAIFADRLEELTTIGTRLLSAPDTGAGLLDFMMAGAEVQIRDRSFCQAAAGIAADHPAVQEVHDRLLAVVEALTERAQRQGVVRADVVGRDVVLLLNGASQAVAPLADPAPELWRRYVGLIFDGFRAEGAYPLPHPPPAPAAR
jgi:AcrR family transcriptional regulator